MTIYLDHNATTQPLPSVVEAMQCAVTDTWHNPSSMHRPGQAARRIVELARGDLAALLGARPREVIFTAGATESISMALLGALDAAPAGRRAIVISAVEHEAITELARVLAARGIDVRTAPVTGAGITDPAAVEALLDDTVALVSVQWANNETGAVHPVGDIARLCRSRGILFHTDATQWVGKMPVDLAGADDAVDLLSLSAHKFHGPKGIGALYVRTGLRLAPTTPGPQELGRRGGTENVPGIAGLGAAAREASAWLANPAAREAGRALRDAMERDLLALHPGAAVNGPPSGPGRLWNTANLGFPGIEAEAMLIALSEAGVCVSAGAACASGSIDVSPVLAAMGVAGARALGSLRFSIARTTTAGEIGEAVSIVRRALAAHADSGGGAG